jgi:hypothetical protein
MLGSGLGLITSSSFFVPQVNVSSNMAAFVTPAAVVSQVPVRCPRPGDWDSRRLRRTLVVGYRCWCSADCS